MLDRYKNRAGFSGWGFMAVVMIAIITFILPTAASAQAASLPTPGSVWDFFGTDHGDPYSSVFFNQLFGPLFPSAIGGSVTSVFSIIIGYFNAIILLIGGLMFFYNVTIGVMQSAHEGQVLGQRWSSLWAPLRVVFAVGMLVPVNEGYNLAQTGVAYIVKGSTKMASAVWSSSADLVLTGDIPIAAVTSNVSPEVIHHMYLNAACMVALEAESRVADPSTSLSYVSGNDISASNGLSASNVSTGYIVNVDDMIGFYKQGQATMQTAIVRDNGKVKSSGVCGSFTTPALPDFIEKQIEAAQADAAVANPNAIKEAFIDGHMDIMSYISSEMRALAKEKYLEIDNSESPILPDISQNVAAIHREANARLSTLNNNLRERYITSNKLRQMMSDRISGGDACTSGPGGDEGRELTSNCYGEGWMGAGSWYIYMARLNNEISTLTTATSSTTPPSYQSSEFGKTDIIGWNVLSLDRGSSMQEVKTNIGHLNQTFVESSMKLPALGYQISSELMADITTDVDASEIMERINIKPYLLMATRGMMEFFDPGKGGQDPMIGLMQIGNMSMAVASTIALGSLAASLIPTLSIGPTLVMVLMPAYSVFITAGVSLTFILPIMPFFFWVLAISGYILLIFEAVIAVNLWALSHLRMDGEGISGESGRMGWLMILSLFMTPTLMVFGFLIGMALFRVVSDLISAGLFYAVSSMMGSSVIQWLYGLVGYTALIVVAYIFLLERSFSLVSEFPNRVMRWMGSSVEIGGGEDRIRAAGAIAAVSVNKAGNAVEGGIGKGRVNPNTGKAEYTGLAKTLNDARNRSKKDSISNDGGSGGNITDQTPKG